MLYLYSNSRLLVLCGRRVNCVSTVSITVSENDDFPSFLDVQMRRNKVGRALRREPHKRTWVGFCLSTLKEELGEQSNLLGQEYL